MNRCTGQCCEVFSLEFSPEALAAEPDRLIALGMSPTDPHVMCRDFPRYDRGSRCSYAGCNWEDVTYQLVPAHRLARRRRLTLPPEPPAMEERFKEIAAGPDEPGALDKA